VSIDGFYVTAHEAHDLSIVTPTSTELDLHYHDRTDGLPVLYEKGKAAQWDAQTRIDWSVGLDQDNPLSYDDRFIPIFGSSVWNAASDADRIVFRRHYQAYTLSQFLHGEQAALVAAGRLVQAIPNVQAKQFAAQQAADEARHVEIFQRLITDHLQIAYPFDPGAQGLIAQGLSDQRWDFVVLTTQVLVEGLALGMLQQLRDFSKSPLISSAAAYVMADEARHVAYGMQELDGYYKELTAYELRERAEFAETGIAALKARLNPSVVWRHLGLTEQECDVAMMTPSTRLADRLTTRLMVMLERLGLKSSGDATIAATRLRHWEHADHRVLHEKF
jgi:hypothetical protein